MLRLVLALLIAIAPVAGIAHDGPHSPDMLVTVISAQQQGNMVTVTLELTGLGGPLVLVGVSTPGAAAAPINPVYVNFAQDVEVTTCLDFAGTPPGVFTLALDFGPIGQGAVTVTPRPGP